jgi:tRNA-dihydrouridine synthase A
MMDWTDRHCRYFLRLIAPSVRLYTEMVTTGALIHGDRDRLLAYHPAEHPLAIQLGGSEPGELAKCAQWAEAAGFDEVNLNVGCPSDRVQSGRFGACLMLEPQLVAECVAAMQAAVSIPVSVKSRTGVDEQDSYAAFVRFVETLQRAGLQQLSVHARKAWLKGLSPKENREVPPLHYERVYRLKREFPDMTIHLNGGITALSDIETHLARVDGVMIGREAYHNPWLLAEIETELGAGRQTRVGRREVVEAMYPYIEQALSEGVRLQQISRHMLGLFQGQPGARAWRRYISENAHREGSGVEVLEAALRLVEDRRPPPFRVESVSS